MGYRFGGNKYLAKPVYIDGIRFASKKEGKRYQELKLLEAKGEITDLQLQVHFDLIPAQREPDTRGKRGGIIKGKLLERKVEYIADFVYTDTETGEKIVEDVKGTKSGEAYKIFTLKRKLMLWVHGIRIREV